MVPSEMSSLLYISCYDLFLTWIEIFKWLHSDRESLNEESYNMEIVFKVGSFVNDDCF